MVPPVWSVCDQSRVTSSCPPPLLLFPGEKKSMKLLFYLDCLGHREEVGTGHDGASWGQGLWSLLTAIYE